MKTLKISFGIAAFAIAVTGALVTKATTQMQTRYAVGTNGCQQVSTEKLCEPAPGDCIDPTHGKLYANGTIGGSCFNELAEE